MKLPHIKYYFLTLSLLTAPLFLRGQSSSNATVTIIGDPVAESAPTDPSISPIPPENGGQLADPQNIEPTLENSFHIRYRIETPQKEKEADAVNEYASLSTSTGPATSSGGTKIKRRHIVTLEERRFNFKKKYKALMPKRKKKYRPNVCGRF